MLENKKLLFDKVKELTKYEVYKIDNIDNINKNLALIYNNDIIRDTNLLNIFDIFVEEETDNILYLIFFSNILKKSYEDTNLSKEQFEEIFNTNSKIIQNKSRFEKKDIILNDRKKSFRIFKEFFEQSLKKNVKGYTFIPIDKRIIENKDNKYLNIYFDKNKNIKNISVKKKREFPHLEKLMKNILQEGYEKFISFLAHKIQNPTDMMPIHWVIIDEGGTGKTEILGDHILNNLFNCNSIGEEELESQYNDWLINQEFVLCEEIEGFTNEKRLKRITGAKEISVSEKYKSTIMTKNYVTIVIFSNSYKSVKISQNDRRWNVVGGGIRLTPNTKGTWEKTLFKSKEENIKFFKGFHKNLKQELQNLYAYLKGLNVKRIDVMQTLNTKLKDEVIKTNETSENLFINEFYENNLQYMVNEYYPKDLPIFYNNALHIKGTELYILSKEIYNIYVGYVKENGLRKLSKEQFFGRLKTNEKFNEIFTSNIRIKENNIANRYREIKPIYFNDYNIDN